MQHCAQMHTQLTWTVYNLRPLLKLSLLVCLGCLANAIPVDAYTPPLTPAPSPVPGRYPVGYDPDNRTRPPSVFPAADILADKPVHPPAWTRTRGEAKADRWTPPLGYDPRSRPPLRRSDTAIDVLVPRGATVDQSVCPQPDCPLDPRKHICTGIWMGRSIIERRCQKLE